jgi:6-phosphogluconate dehydrogenase
MSAPYLRLRGAHEERKISLEEGHTWKIGRNADNEVVLFNDLVSRHHALLQHNGAGQYYLMDMGSRNGSFVNGSRMSFPVLVKDPDMISLGDYQLSFHWPEGVAQAAAPSVSTGSQPTRALYASRKSSVLVVDIQGFTQLSRQIDPSLQCNLIGSWFREGGRPMQEKGSWSQKYIGDALMSVWVHQNSEREPQQVWGILKACVEFVKLTDQLQPRFGLAFPIRVGMGINSGDAMLGNTGGAGSNDYTALGDTVNAAFRFESATRTIGMDVILGRKTFERLSRCSDPQRYFEPRTVRRRMRGGHECVVFDLSRDNVKRMEGEGAVGGRSMEDFVQKLSRPRAGWVTVPAGRATESTMMKRAELIEPGDTIIDGGNSYYKDDVRRAGLRKDKGILYVDVGTSGGVWGIEREYCMMVGGPDEAVKRLDPILLPLAPGMGDVPRTPRRDGRAGTADQGYLHCGPCGAGHFVKMVHNGIEYGLMQAYAERFDIFKHTHSKEVAPEDRFNLDLTEIAEVWRHGSVVGRWLLDLTTMALIEDPELPVPPETCKIPGRAPGRSWRRLRRLCHATCSRRPFTPASGRARITPSRKKCYPACAINWAATSNARRATRKLRFGRANLTDYRSPSS